MYSSGGEPVIRILYVDDEPSLLDLAKIYLEKSSSFRIDTEESASKALECLRERSYDAVVSDYQMPGMDGIEFLKTIRNMGNTIPFIIFTGKGREEVVIQAFDNGADYYIQKGPDVKTQYAELEQKIRRAVEYRRVDEAMGLANLVKWEYDIAGDTFTFNDRFYALYGTTKEREGGILMSSEEYAKRFVHPDDRHLVAEEVGKALDEANQSGFLSDLEHRIIRRDGEIRHIVVRIGLIKDENGRNIKTYGANQDITERKIVENVLLVANKRLRNLNDEIRRNIMHQIDDMVILMQDARGMTKQKKCHDLIAEGIDKADLIKRQIDFTREYRDIGAKSPCWQNIPDLIAGAEREFSGYSCDVDIYLDPVEMYADPLVGKVFFNLMENAEIHGEGATRISFSGKESGDDYILFCEDNGCGIDPGMKKALFTSSYGKNTGFGLFLAKEILSITDISIDETGEPGKGTRFEITIPKEAYRTSLAIQ